MTWAATAVTVGASLYSTYSSIQGGKARAEQDIERGRQSMLTAYRRIANRNITSYLATEDVKERGGDAVINQYMASNKDIKNTKAEASGSGAVISGTVKDVMRSKEKQLDAVVTSINDNTEKNIEGITRDTIAQNKEDLIKEPEVKAEVPKKVKEEGAPEEVEEKAPENKVADKKTTSKKVNTKETKAKKKSIKK